MEKVLMILKQGTEILKIKALTGSIKEICGGVFLCQNKLRKKNKGTAMERINELLSFNLFSPFRLFV